MRVLVRDITCEITKGDELYQLNVNGFIYQASIEKIMLMIEAMNQEGSPKFAGYLRELQINDRIYLYTVLSKILTPEDESIEDNNPSSLAISGKISKISNPSDYIHWMSPQNAYKYKPVVLNMRELMVRACEVGNISLIMDLTHRNNIKPVAYNIDPRYKYPLTYVRELKERYDVAPIISENNKDYLTNDVLNYLNFNKSK